MVKTNLSVTVQYLWVAPELWSLAALGCVQLRNAPPTPEEDGLVIHSLSFFGAQSL